MKKLFTLCFAIVLNLSPYFSFAQFADKEYYLIDSLDISILSAQDKHLLDSCLKVYHTSKTDSIKITALNGICNNMMDNSWEKYQYFQYNILTKSIADKPTSEKLKFLEKALASAQNNIGLILQNKGDVKQALEYYYKGLKIQEKYQDKYGIANIYNNLGSTHHMQEDYSTALDFYLKSITLLEEIDEKYGLSFTYNNIGDIYNKQDNKLKALEYYQKSLKLREELQDKEAMAYSYISIGVINENMGNSQLALEYYKKSLFTQEEISDKRGLHTH